MVKQYYLPFEEVRPFQSSLPIFFREDKDTKVIVNVVGDKSSNFVSNLAMSRAKDMESTIWELLEVLNWPIE